MAIKIVWFFNKQSESIVASMKKVKVAFFIITHRLQYKTSKVFQLEMGKFGEFLKFLRILKLKFEGKTSQK